MIPELRPLRADDGQFLILDQTQLPYAEEWRWIASLEDALRAIRDMQVRGAPLIGVTAAFGVALALREDPSDASLATAVQSLGATRPTAVNLRWALARMRKRLAVLPPSARGDAAWGEAQLLAAEDAAANRAIGEHGLALLQPLAARGTLRVMTHCNAGWLATAGFGTALAPVYAAHANGIAVHVYASETRPRNQGLLTAWELVQAGVPHTLVADNAAGHLMRQGKVDAVIVGADRIAANGDVANKIGTYLKALAARAAGLPFYVAAPRSTIDLTCPSGAAIPIEERDGEEVRLVRGAHAVARVAERATPVLNPAFDVTPAELVTAIVTERGAVAPDCLARLFEGPQHG